MYSILSRRGLFRSLHFPLREPRQIFPSSSQPYTPRCTFLSTLPSSVHTGQAKCQGALTPAPNCFKPCPSPFLSNSSPSSDHSRHNLIPPWITVELIQCSFPPELAKVLTAVGLAIIPSSIRGQRPNGNIVKDACLRQQRMTGTQELQGRCPTWIH